jgi:hydrogenase/urease accessory protein HupE
MKLFRLIAFRTIENMDVFVGAYRDVFTAFLRAIIGTVFVLGMLFANSQLYADVVKPALVEISVKTSGQVDIELRASVEALLTGINSKYRNTKEAPTSDAYDELRELEAPELLQRFESFHQKLLDSIELKLDDQRVGLSITKIDIPEPGYTKVPRNSAIYLTAPVDRNAKTLTWYYPEAFGDNAVRVRQVDEENQLWHWSEWQWIKSDKPSEAFSLTEIFTKRPVLSVVKEYIIAGFEHILPMGLDHILFIVGIFLLSTRMRPLLWQVTMFTVAHSITLGLSMTGKISLPSNIVEPLIALSIAYIGIENIWHKTLHNSRLVIVFGFGLLHGMGFASVLQEFGMPADAFMTALISFNVGVELGQLAIILLGFLSVGLWFRNRDWYRNVIIIPGSAVIALTGLFWTYDRIVF